jgi:PKD repeat protein
LIGNIKLSYFQSDFSIKYAALNYLNPSQNQYRYILEGYEKEWHEVGNQREAVYTNIDPGKYTFKVMGSNNDGIWSENPASLDIYITPPGGKP